MQDFEKNSVQKVQAGWRLPKLISRIIPKYCHLQRVRISHRMPNCLTGLLLSYTKFPLNALTNLLTENFVERGGRRRQAGACQGGQRSYTEFNAINVKVF